MNLRNNRALAASLPLFLCISGSVFAQPEPAQENELDPWFEQHLEDRPSADDEESAKDGSVSLRGRSPEAIARKARNELAITPETNISRRISLLQEIASTGKIEDKEQQDLSELKSARNNAIEALAQAGQAGVQIESALAMLKPFANYFSRDPSLLVAMLESNFATQLDRRIQILGRQSDTQELERLTAAVEDSGLSTVFRKRLQITANDSLAVAVARKWDELSRQFNPLPGEAFLLNRALNQNEKRLRVVLELPPNSDAKVARNLSRSIETRWGNTVEIVEVDSRINQPELVLKVDSATIESTEYSSEETLESVIPGEVTEEPNPEFLRLVEKYKKAAEAYEISLDSYESQYRDYIDQMDDQEFNRAQTDLKQAENRLNATPAITDSGQPNPDYSEARVEYELARGLANSITPMTIPEPVPPLPRHLDILDDLYLLPSTIVTSTENTPYEYTSQNVEYRFLSESQVTLQTPAVPWVKSDTSVSLSQSRKWTKNLGVDPRDPSLGNGTYSNNEYDSALDLFTLEFGARCAEKLEILLSEASAQLRSEQSGDAPLDRLILSLALEFTSNSSAPQLSDEELGDLAKLAQTPDIDPSQFRAECLALLLSKTRYKDFADPQQISQYL